MPRGGAEPPKTATAVQGKLQDNNLKTAGEKQTTFVAVAVLLQFSVLNRAVFRVLQFAVAVLSGPALPHDGARGRCVLWRDAVHP